ncbi:MAG: hypothetical protein ACTSV0_09890 [Candidatus Freyarchaeota archaeon]
MSSSVTLGTTSPNSVRRKKTPEKMRSAHEKRYCGFWVTSTPEIIGVTTTKASLPPLSTETTSGGMVLTDICGAGKSWESRKILKTKEYTTLGYCTDA